MRRYGAWVKEYGPQRRKSEDYSQFATAKFGGVGADAIKKNTAGYPDESVARKASRAALIST
jgi:hypothetical protein